MSALDLREIVARARRVYPARGWNGDEGERALHTVKKDVPALVREVRRLREELAGAEASTALVGDVLRRTAVALKGAPPPLTTWSTHDLPDVAASLRAEVERLRSRVAELERLAAGPATTEPVDTATWGRVLA